MAREVELTREALVELGAERLAALLLEHAAADERLEGRLKLALAARRDEGAVVRLLRGRIARLGRGRGFVERYETPGLAAEIDEIRAAVADDVVPKAPRAAAELLEALVDTAEEVYGEADDSDGVIAAAYREAIVAWGRAWSLVPDRHPETLAETVLEQLQENDYGVKDGVIPAFAGALGEAGLAELRRLLTAELERHPPPAEGAWDYKRSALVHGLADVADARGDVDAYVDALRLDGPPERRGAEIARRMLAAARPAEALDWLDRAEKAGGARHQAVDLRIAALEALGRGDEAQAVRWDWFRATLSLPHFRDFAERLTDPAARERARADAVATAERHGTVNTALGFLAEIGEPAAAERLIVSRTAEIDGRHYYSLRPVAEALAPTHPLGAVILHRLMALAVLRDARSQSYPYAARDVVRAGELAERVSDWSGFEPHAVFMQALRQAHRLKRSFWPLLDGR